MTVDELVVEMSVDSNKVSIGLDKARSFISDFVTGIGISFGQMFGRMTQELISQIPRVFNSMKEEVKELDELSKRTNASVEDISAWGNAIEMSGGSAKKFQHTLSALYNDLSRASFVKRTRSKPFLDALGLDAKDLAKKNIMDAMKDISKAVQGMDKQKSSFALKNLGFDPDTIKFLQSGDIDSAIARQKELGVYTDKDAKAIDKMDKTIKQMSHTIKAFFIPVFSRIIEVSNKLLNYIPKVTKFFKNNIDIIKKAVLLLGIAFSVKLVRALKDTWKMLKTNPFILFIAGLTILLLLLEDLYVYSKGGKSAFAGLWEKLGDPKRVERGFRDVGDAIQSFSNILDSTIGQIALFSTFFGRMIFNAPRILAAFPAACATAMGIAVALLLGFVVVYRKELLGAVEFFVNAIMDIPNILSRLIDECMPFVNDVVAFFTDPIPKIQKKWEEFKEWFVREFGSLEAIQKRMVNNSMSAQMARTEGGVTNVTNIEDKRNISNNFNNREAVEAGTKKMGAVSYAESGVSP